MIKEAELMRRASMRKPLPGCAAYQKWRHARIKLGLPTRPAVKKTADMRTYNREYMRKYRREHAQAAKAR